MVGTDGSLEVTYRGSLDVAAHRADIAAEDTGFERVDIRWRGALAILAAVIVLVAASCSGDGGREAASSSTSSPRAETTTTSMPPGGYEEPPDGGEIRIVEQGFTPGESAYVNLAGHHNDMVSWGMILENTSDYTAHVRPHVAYFDASGNDLGECSCIEAPLYVQAGASIAVAERGGPETAGSGAGPGVARIEATVEVFGWWPAEPPEGYDPELYQTMMQQQVSMTTAQEASFDRTERGAPAISYSGAGEAIERVWAVIFRNAEGDIIGGLDNLSERDGATGRILFDPAVMDLPGIDQAQIEVYVTLL